MREGRGEKIGGCVSEEHGAEEFCEWDFRTRVS